MTIWKYSLDLTSVQEIDMPKGAQILDLHVQNGQPCFWAIVDEDAPKEKRIIRKFHTNHRTEDPSKHRYLGTLLLGDRVAFHFFEQSRNS